MATIDIKAGQANTVPVGILVDVDGVTPVTASISPKISINGAAQADPTNDTTHLGGGEHVLELTAAECVAGRLISVTVPGVADTRLPDQRLFRVLPANVWDSLYGGTDNLQVDVVQQLGVAVTPAYQAIVTVHQISGAQVYAISWLKNGVPVTIATPTIQITTLAASPANLLDVADDGVLPATVVGSSNVAFLSDGDELLTAGVGYRYVVTASIDSATRTFQGTFFFNGNAVPTTTQQIADAIWRQSSAQMAGHETAAGANSAAAQVNDVGVTLSATSRIEDELSGLRITGTVEAGGGTTTAVTANFDVALAANALAGRVIVFPDGTLPNRRITANTAGAESTLTFDSALPSAPGNGVVFAVLGYVEPAS